MSQCRRLGPQCRDSKVCIDRTCHSSAPDSQGGRVPSGISMLQRVPLYTALHGASTGPARWLRKDKGCYLSRPARLPHAITSRLPASAVRTVAPSRKAPTAHGPRRYQLSHAQVLPCPRRCSRLSCARSTASNCSHARAHHVLGALPYPQRLPAAVTLSSLLSPLSSLRDHTQSSLVPARRRHLSKSPCPSVALLPLARRRMHRFSQCSSSLPCPMSIRLAVPRAPQSPQLSGRGQVSNKCKRLMLHPQPRSSPPVAAPLCTSSPQIISTSPGAPAMQSVTV